MAQLKNIIEDIFTPFQESINVEQSIREEIRSVTKEIEKSICEIVTTMQVIHRTNQCTEITAACAKSRGIFEVIRGLFAKLNDVVPQGEFYRYHDHWRTSTQRLCFLAALVVFLEKGFLIDRDTAAEILGVKETSHLQLDLEDYLMGLLNLATELSRFAVNSVTYGDYERPLQISKFVAELNTGFRLLNMKNDSLRRRFDALKYDVKKIEEVVYDLSLRGLVGGTAAV